LNRIRILEILKLSKSFERSSNSVEKGDF